ncbi:MAG: lysylphosphatidylglycerol synthase transmembrane domain-containing protein [Bacteroidales bacterium]|nr:lysylphosphatidylglycerol synthase transmembrane domain-containing protein [Bacteroidales bacterium]
MSTEIKLKETFSFKRVIIPILIGIGFSVFSLMDNDFEFSYLRGIEYSLLYILLALLMMLIRDAMYVWRLRILLEKQLSIMSSLQVILLWEFASSVSPSMVGGSAFALFFINAEGVKLGKSTAIVMITALLDELFYIFVVALILLFYGTEVLQVQEILSINVTHLFFIGYGFIVALTTVILCAIFIFPQGFKKLLTAVFSLPFIRKWKEGAARTGDDIITTSIELKHKKPGYWIKSFTITAFSWTARFLVLNCLVLALNPEMEFQFSQQVMIYAKQLVMWVILLISPTPGASGIAEAIFPAFFGGDFPANLQDAVALLWRGISYYPYLFIGLIVLPIWLSKLEKRRISKLKHKEKENENKTEC